MPKSTAFNNDLLKLIFNGTAIANLADNAASSPLTTLSLALHTADPGIGGSQSTSEVAYTGYARVTAARTTGGFSVSGNVATVVATINFPACTGGSATATFASVGVATSGATKILYTGAVSPSIAIANGTTPQLTTGSTFTET